MTRVSTTEFRTNLAKYKDLVARKPTERIAVTDRNSTVFMVVSPDYIEGLEATVELLADPAAMKALAASAADVRAGRLVTHQQVRKLAGLE
jgi:PHD/YefM family antitoxin component YafN of YafNO toxin-antitoxin module